MWSLLSGEFYPPFLCVVIVQMLLTPVYPPHQIARGGRDLGGVKPPPEVPPVHVEMAQITGLESYCMQE